MTTRSRYSNQALEEAVQQSTSYAGVLRILGIKQAGGSQSHITKRVKALGFDTSHFTGQAHNRGKISNNRKAPREILIVMPEGSFRAKTHQLKRAMIESSVDYRCGASKCPHPEPVWGDKELVLEIDHLDGNWLNNLLENLRFTCPNCHSQEPTNRPWKWKN